jgi:hypothetical protein
MTFLITENNSELFLFKDHSYPCYKTDKGLNQRVLNQLTSLIEKSLSHYSKVSILRIDLHPNNFTQDNKVISTFITKQVKRLEQEYYCKVSYFFAREQNTSDKQHYHLALFFSGHKVNNAYKIEQTIKDEWLVHCGGTVHFVKKPLLTIERGNKKSIDPAIYRLSYLTKHYSKENNGTAQSYSYSRLKYKGAPPLSDALFVNPNITYRNRNKVELPKVITLPIGTSESNNASDVKVSHSSKLSRECISQTICKDTDIPIQRENDPVKVTQMIFERPP